MFQPSTSRKPTGGKTEGEVQCGKPEIRKLGTEVGDIKDGPEKCHKEVTVIKLPLQPLGRQRFATNQACRVPSVMKPNDSHLS